ncbi:MAG: dUTPase [Limnochordia bacterium]|nr:dUTPase [Bacillota bacterium]HOB40050.1 dUTPase [Limnochordia bacterium]HPZ79418.1 dUTPase [Limnochordia bacterium]HQE36277.1 dUTPase [Limnochordia bacterium]
MEKDMLKDIFHLQERFDRAVVEKRGLNFSQEVWIQKEVLAIMSELAEILDEVNFKWWKDPKEIDRERLLEEIVDVLHFFVSMCLKAGIGPEELYRAYIRKNQENFARQEGRTDREGYAWNK